MSARRLPRHNFTLSPRAGNEINGFGERWLYAAGMANGNPGVPSGRPPETT